jgi:alpha-ribazole phosphatase/probable phosphoglycerate mutase
LRDERVEFVVEDEVLRVPIVRGLLYDEDIGDRRDRPRRSPRRTRLAGRARGTGRMSEGVRVWCLRHAEAEHGTTGTTGTAGARLTARGRHQAIAAAQQLAAEPITRIYTSTALRARQTAELLGITLGATAAGLPIIRITAMPELIEAECTADVLRAWVIEQELGRRAADGETGQQVVARVTAAFQQIASVHPRETVAVVGHVASLTVALGRLCALGAGVWGTPLPHAQPFLIEWDGRAWHCSTWPALGPAIG